MTIPVEKQTLCECCIDEPEVNQLEYKEAIGNLQYSATISRPDKRLATRKLARYTVNQLSIYGRERSKYSDIYIV